MNMKKIMISILAAGIFLLPLFPIVTICPVWMKFISVLYVLLIFKYRKSSIIRKFIKFEMAAVKELETLLMK